MDDRGAKEYVPGYWVTDDGRVWSDKSNQWLKQTPDKDGYMQVSIRDRGVHERLFVHRMVARLFVPNPDDKPQVNHDDGNKSNNHHTNLVWSTQPENIQHAFDNGLNTQKYSKPVVQIIDGEVVGTFASITEASRITGVSRYSISRCVTGKTDMVCGYQFRMEV